MNNVTIISISIISYQNLEENYNSVTAGVSIVKIISYQNLEENYNQSLYCLVHYYIISYQNLEENYNIINKPNTI